MQFVQFTQFVQHQQFLQFVHPQQFWQFVHPEQLFREFRALIASSRDPKKEAEHLFPLSSNTQFFSILISFFPQTFAAFVVALILCQPLKLGFRL
jgi:hypothetical protein